MQPPIFLATADPTFVLTAGQRARIPANVDPQVLERVLARVRPEFREHFLDETCRFHDDMRAAGKVAAGQAQIGVDDPEIKSLLGELFRTY